MEDSSIALHDRDRSALQTTSEASYHQQQLTQRNGWFTAKWPLFS